MYVKLSDKNYVIQDDSYAKERTKNYIQTLASFTNVFLKFIAENFARFCILKRYIE